MAFENINIIQSFQLKFCKFILKLKPSTPYFIIDGEPFVVHAKARLLCYLSIYVSRQSARSRSICTQFKPICIKCSWNKQNKI